MGLLSWLHSLRSLLRPRCVRKLLQDEARAMVAETVLATAALMIEREVLGRNMSTCGYEEVLPKKASRSSIAFPAYLMRW